jgi:hypothetical protein
MTHSSPIHDLRKRIETARLQLIEELAAKGGHCLPKHFRRLRLYNLR